MVANRTTSGESVPVGAMKSRSKVGERLATPIAPLTGAYSPHTMTLAREMVVEIPSAGGGQNQFESNPARHGGIYEINCSVCFSNLKGQAYSLC